MGKLGVEQGWDAEEVGSNDERPGAGLAGRLAAGPVEAL